MGLRTPLHEWHVAQSAKIVDFGGWDMPVVYSSILEEHAATRTSGGLFDVCHMGRFTVEGPGAAFFLELVATQRIADLAIGQARYGFVLNEEAGVLDDILVYRLPTRHLVVVNASNREKVLDWFRRHLPAFEATLVDRTFEWGMIAFQGPKAVGIAETVLETRIAGIGYYRAREDFYKAMPMILSRTGYTGEDGLEIIVPSDCVVEIWNSLLDAGAHEGVRAAGLGARDTLRLEAGMPLYGHELNEEIDPIQARLLKTPKEAEFLGKKALMHKSPKRPVRVGLLLKDKRIAREGFLLFDDEEEVGWISSGTYGPTVNASIAMGYVKPDRAEIGRRLSVQIRAARVGAEIVPLPFYKRPRQPHSLGDRPVDG